MKEVILGVWQLTGFPRHAVNAYVVGDVLVDCGTSWAARRIVRQLAGRQIRLIALTHGHPDHRGSAARLCRYFQAPLACHEQDVPMVEGRGGELPDNVYLRAFGRLGGGSPKSVDRLLEEGNVVAGFRVIHAPGHTPGHVVFFRESDRVAIVGDVLVGMNLVTMIPGLAEPPRIFSHDPEENRRSIRKLLALSPSALLFGHGPPMLGVERVRDRLERLARAMEAARPAVEVMCRTTVAGGASGRAPEGMAQTSTQAGMS